MSAASVHKPGVLEREVIQGFVKRRQDDLRRAVPTDPLTGDPADAQSRLDCDRPEPNRDDPRDVAASTRMAHRRGAERAMTQSWQSPMGVAVAISFARTLDGVSGLVDSLWIGSPRVLVDVPDPLALALLRSIWSELLYGDGARIESVTRALSPVEARTADVLTLIATEPAKPRDREDDERALLQALAVATPILGLSPDATTCLPRAALRAADHRLVLAAIDAHVIATTITVVTGRRCRSAQRDQLAGLDLQLADLAIAIRADRSPAACIAALVRLARQSPGRSGIGRDLALDQVHGAKEAVAWARATLRDLAAWRDGAAWQEVSAGALLTGPPGCGKTLLASVMAAEGNLPLITGSLAQWQSTGQAHLGTTLKAMREAFAEAKAKANPGGGRRGAILLIDEADSFPDRSKITHAYADYVVEVGNALLELLDGAESRDGVVVLATTNDAGRCDPAMLRPGRLSKVIAVGFPDLDERVAMLRVRLGNELPDVDLLPVARLTERATGAVIEELVADARRIARHQERALELADLIAVAGKADAERSPALLYRTAIHEAGHALAAVLEIGPDDLVVALQSRDGAAGWVEMAGREGSAGTRAEIEASIRVLLAGRAAEETVLGCASAGARQDLSAATTLVANLIGCWGLGQARLLSLGQARPSEILADPSLMDEARVLLDQLYAQACKTLDHHRPALERIANRLLAERRLDGAMVAALIDRPIGQYPVEPASGQDDRTIDATTAGDGLALNRGAPR